MKIAFIVGGFPKLSETFILNQITGLIDRGHDIDIYADSSTNEPKVHPDIEKYNILARTYYFRRPSNRVLSILKGVRLSLINLHKNPIVIFRSWDSSKYDKQHAFSRLMLLYMVLPFLKKQSYDIVHCHFGQNGMKGAMLKSVGLLQGKLVTTFHGQDITKYPQEFGKDFYQQLFNTGDLFLPISERWNQCLLELGCNSEKIITHHMGIDCSRFSFAPRHLNSKEKIRVLTVARLTEKKGIEYAIRAIKKLSSCHQNVEYNIVGDGPLKTSLQKLIQDLDVGHVINLLGWKQQQEVIDLLNSSSLLLAPSVTSKDGDQEGIPVGIMEAMAIGLPVVSTWHSGIPELIEDGVSGFLVAERDEEALFERLKYLIDHPEIWSEVGAAGRKCIESHYNINYLNDQLVQLYQKLQSET